MATPLNKNLELVSSQNQVKSKKDQMLENLKLEMLKDLKIDDKLIKRNTIQEKIFKARENELFPKSISIGKKTIEIKEQGKYKDIVAQYIKANTENPTDKEEICKQLDKELTEQIILDQNKMIEFSSTEKFEGKTAEEEAKASFERLDKNDKYNKKIELIKKTKGEVTHFIIKRTKEQLEELERAEKAYEALHDSETQQPVVTTNEPTTTEGPQLGIPTLQEVDEKTEIAEKMRIHGLKILGNQLKNMKIGEITDLKMPNGKIIRLLKKNQYGRECMINQVPEFSEYIEHEKDENDDKKHARVSNEVLWKFLGISEEQKLLSAHPEQKLLTAHKEPLLLPPHIEESVPVNNEGKLGPVELTATISDTTKITRAIAEHEAGEKLRKMYKNTARYKPRSRPTKAALFVGRGYMKDYYTRKYMNMKGDMQLGEGNENLTNAADRHAMELEKNFENLDKIATIDETNYPETYKEIQIIKDQLIQGTINEKHFEDDFKAIIENKTLDASNPVSKIINDNNIQQTSSNIVQEVLAFRDHQKLVKEITNRIKGDPNLKLYDPASERNFNIFARNKIVEYFNTYKKNPAFLKTLNIKLDDADAMRKLSNYQAHHGSLLMIARQTMNLKVQILTKGEEAYNVKQELKGFRGTITKRGDRLDKPISDTSSLGKYLEKHPFIKNAFGILRGATKLGTMVTPAILLGLTGACPLAIAGAAGTMALGKTLIKKHSDYNKEHIGYQRNQAVNIFENRKEREKLMNEMSKMNPATRFMRYHFGLGKKARDVRQFRDYVMTTHDQMANTKKLAENIDNLLQLPHLDGSKPRDLENLIGQALARLNFHKKTGQNFLGSANKDEAEKEYQNIYRLVLTGAMRLDKDLSSFENTTEYEKEMKLIENGTGKKPNEIGYQKSRKRFKQQQTKKALVGAVKAGGVAFGLSYLATSLASTNSTTNSTGDQTSVGDNFILGKHELATDNNIYNQSKEFFGNTNTGHQTISFQYGGGTDATHVVAGHLTQTEYVTKIADVQKEIIQMTNISTTTKANLINEIQNKPWEHVRAQKGFTNDYLQGMRCIEGLEQTAKALNDSGVNAGTITLKAAYNGSVYDIVGQTYNNAGERIVQGALEYSQNIVTPENIIPIPIPGYMNTFKRADGDEDENKKTNNDYGQSRKTISPAPKVKPQNENNQTRKRSGESTEERRFTNGK